MTGKMQTLQFGGFSFLREELPTALLSFQGREGASRALGPVTARLSTVRGLGLVVCVAACLSRLPASAFSGGDRLYHRELVLTKSGESHFGRKAWPRGVDTPP